MASYPLGIDVVIKGLGGINQLNNSLNRLERQGASLANTFRIVRAAIIAFGGAQVINQAIQLQKTTEKYRMSLDALTGSIDKGAKAYQAADRFSSEYGFELEKVLKATQTLIQDGKPLEQIPRYYNLIGAAARATGGEIDNIAEEFVKVKDSGLESAKLLGPAFKIVFPNIYEQIKNSGTLSVQAIEEYYGSNGAMVQALNQGQNGMAKALNDVTKSFDYFITKFLGTDNQKAMENLAKVIKFVSDNLIGFEVALGAVALAIGGPAGVIVGVVALTKALWDLLHVNKGIYQGNIEGAYDQMGNYVGDLTDKINTNNQALQEQSDKMQQVIGKCIDTNVLYQQIKDNLDSLSPSTQILGGIADAWKKIKDENQLATQASQLTIDAYHNISNAASSALLNIINGSKSAKAAGRELGQVIVNEILMGLIKLYIVGPIMRFISGLIDEQIDKWKKEKQAIDSTNSSLQRQIGLRLVLMALGFAGGGPVQAGGQPAQARAIGGTTSANMPYLVGERGPELFMPNSNGYIVPNDKLNMDGGTDYSSSSMGGANITFNINTLDARGVDQLLMQRQDMIVGMINRALRERGKRQLV